MSGMHIFKPLCTCEDKMSIKKVFHSWHPEIAASVHGRYRPSRLDWPHMLATISEGQKWKTFLILILSLHGHRGSKKVHSQHCSILLELGQPPSHMWVSSLMCAQGFRKCQFFLEATEGKN